MFVGIDGYIDGWCCCIIHDGVKIELHKNLTTLFENIGINNLTLIDMPVGLSSKNFERFIDFKLRTYLPKNKKSSVFTAPCREAVLSNDYNSAKKANQIITNRSISIQSWNISKKIKELDRFLISQKKNKLTIKESHPEFCFVNLNNNNPLIHSKKTNEGYNERLSILIRNSEGIEIVVKKSIEKFKKEKVKKDDILDSIVLALTSKYWQKNGSRTITQNPEKDEMGIPFEIYY
jgi:predicted RNase H-like nuclease